MVRSVRGSSWRSIWRGIAQAGSHGEDGIKNSRIEKSQEFKRWEADKSLTFEKWELAQIFGCTASTHLRSGNPHLIVTCFPLNEANEKTYGFHRKRNGKHSEVNSYGEKISTGKN